MSTHARHHVPGSDDRPASTNARPVAAVLLLLLIVTAVIVPPSAEADDVEGKVPVLEDPAPRPSDAGPPELDWSLRRLLDESEHESPATLNELAELSGLRVERGRVEVVIEAREGALPAARQAADAAGAIETGSYRQLVRAWVPPARLEQLAASPAVLSVRPPERPVLLNDVPEPALRTLKDLDDGVDTALPPAEGELQPLAPTTLTAPWDRPPNDVPAVVPDSEIVFEHGFETWPGPWSVGGPAPTWGRTGYRKSVGSYSAYCAGSTIAAPGPYANNMNAWLVAGPFNLASLTTGTLSFDLWLDSEVGYDGIVWALSTDGANFNAQGISGNTGGWYPVQVDLASFPGGPYLGRSAVWLAFVFQSDSSIVREGAYLDAVRISSGVPGVVSQGVAETGATALHDRGIDGSGVKIGIIDAGFAGYQSLLGTELPSSVTTWRGSILGPEGGGSEVHGTAVAEVVHDMAPGAQLYLAQVYDTIEIGNAATWMRSQGVKVVNMSLGNFVRPGDGTGLLNDIVNQTVQTGDVFWANSAGNHQRKHWGGDFRSWEGTSWHGWTSTSPLQTFSASAGSAVAGVLTWDDDWSAARQDYDLCLMRDTGSSWAPQACSENVQNGVPGQQPVEMFQWSLPVTGTYGWAILRYSATRTDVDFDFFDLQRDLEHRVTARSLVAPADNPSAGFMAAAAILRPPSYTRATYSSEGPTRDGRLAPHISAPAEVANVSYGTFGGTSASSPHLAGAAALVRQARPASSASAVRSTIQSSAIDLGPAGPDTLFGHGRLWLDLPDERPYVPVTPARVLDTRDSVHGDLSAPVGHRQTVTTTVAGRGGVPSNAKAVAINITAVTPTQSGYLTVWPSGKTRPTVSSINFPAGSVVGNFVIAELGADGKLAIYNHNGLTDVVFDVVGYLPAATDYTPVTPARVLDTRDSVHGDLSAPVGHRATATTTVAGRGGVPADATAVAINITAVTPTQSGYLTVWPSGKTRPTVSSINFPAGSVVGNFVIAELGADGKLAIYNHNGLTDVVFDVVGYYRTGSS
jgi:hypothetical protein